MYLFLRVFIFIGILHSNVKYTLEKYHNIPIFTKIVMKLFNCIYLFLHHDLGISLLGVINKLVCLIN